MTDHTPGPWAVLPDGRPNMEWNNHIIDFHGNVICFMTHTNDHENVAGLANAKLVAAAPAMFDALVKATVNEYNPFEPDNQSKFYHELKSLISEVAGKS